MRLDVFKYALLAVVAIALFIVVVTLCGCTMYKINLDHPEGTEFDNTDKRTESVAKHV
jgi:hypothetical protein